MSCARCDQLGEELRRERENRYAVSERNLGLISANNAYLDQIADYAEQIAKLKWQLAESERLRVEQSK